MDDAIIDPEDDYLPDQAELNDRSFVMKPPALPGIFEPRKSWIS